MYVCISIYLSICTHIYIYIYLSIYLSIYLYVHTHIYIYLWDCISNIYYIYYYIILYYIILYIISYYIILYYIIYTVNQIQQGESPKLCMRFPCCRRCHFSQRDLALYSVVTAPSPAGWRVHSIKRHWRGDWGDWGDLGWEIMEIWRLPSGKHTKSYWKLSFRVSFPIKNDDFP